MDFGASARDGQRHSSECVGTAYYAPERARVMFGGGEPPAVSPSHDVWAFGVLAYEQCAGVPLFSHDLVDDDIRDDDERNRLCMWRWPSDETLSKVFAGNDTDATEAQRAAACNLIARCLDGDPAKRPDSREILDHPFLREDGELEPLDCRYHFFLSHYQAQASGAVAGLYFHLRLRGALVWLDQYQEDITESGMRAGVEASDVFIFFLTSRALTRPFCLKEFGWALDAGKPIVLVREDDERFSPWRYDKWREGKAWDPQVRGWIPDDQYANFATGPNRQLRDEVDRQAKAGHIITYRRRDFEAKAMLCELLRLTAHNPSVLWRTRAHNETMRISSASPLRMLFVHHEPTGRVLVDRLQDAFGARVRQVSSAANADVVLAVLSGGALAAGASSRSALEDVLRLRGDPPVRFVHSRNAGWEFYSAEHTSAPQIIQAAIAETESMIIRDSGYEHAAMVDELLRRCELAARAGGGAASQPSAPVLMSHVSY